MKKLIILFFSIACLQAQSQVKDADNMYLLDLFQSQRYMEASDYLKEVYPEPISDKKILSRFGYSLRMAGKLSEAEKYYSRILETDSTDVATLFSVAGINQAKGNLTKAKEYYIQILSVDSANFSVYKQLSNLVESSEGLPFAIGYLQKANGLNPTDGDIAYSFSKALRIGKQYEFAERVLDSAIAGDSTNFILIRGKAELAFATNKWHTVIDMCNKLIAEGEIAGNVLQMLGQAFYSIKDYKQAIEVFSGLEKLQLQSESIMYYTAMSYKNLKNYPKALEYFDKTLKESISPNTADYYAQIGDTNEKNNKVKQALAAYQRSMTFDTKPITLYSIATLYDQKLKDTASAVRYYRRFINTKTSPGHSEYVEYSKYRITALTK